MIKSIHIKDVASYDSNGVHIEQLKRVNFIYGSNGSGKTTISNFLNDEEDSMFPNCELKWLGNDKLETLVYNKEFRDRNFSKGVVEGVFTLGEATKEQIQEIEDSKKENDELKKEIIEKRQSIEKLKQKISTEREEFKEDVWQSAYKKYEKEFKEAFKGFMQKAPFMEELLKQYSQNKEEFQEKNVLVEKAKTLFGTTPEKLDKISLFDEEDLNSVESAKIWQKRIIGKADVDIAKIIQRLNISDWVHEGRGYLEDNDICPFCQKETIDGSFRKQLNDFFDKEFVDNTKTLKETSEKYQNQASVIIETCREIADAQGKLKESKLNLEKFKPLLSTLEIQVTAVKELIDGKLKEPSRAIDLPSVQTILVDLLNLIKKANTSITEHNKMVLNYHEEKQKLINEIWRFIADQEKDTLKAFNQKISGLNKVYEKEVSENKARAKKWKEIDDKIKELNKNVTSVQPTVDEINRLLQFYGFINFEIVPLESDPNQYQVLREDGTLAEDTLSEGEITFITFLYFYQLIKGGKTEETVNSNRIVVIDDPISSLDSSVLFVISSLIKEMLKKVRNGESNIKQVLLLTHNVYFHKEVSFRGPREKGESPNFWILRKKDNASVIQSYESSNPINSSYELLWNELRNWKKSSGITVQNIMRRILENYFSILGNSRDDYIIESFENFEEQEICRSLLSWTNEGSHTLPDDFLIEVPDDTIEKYLDVFKGIFEKTRNIGHYSMMMKELEENV